MNTNLDQMTMRSERRFVKVAPPTVHAGVGNALRDAFRVNGEMRRTDGFDDLLNRMS